MSAVKKVLVVEQLKRTQMNELLGRGKRLDGRSLLDMRDLSVTTNVVEKAEGSARVKLGNTEVIAGGRVRVGTACRERPGRGLVVVSGGVLPLASAYAE